MVSFFGLKVGGKKKKSEGKSGQEKQPQQWKRIDQNKLGEGQFFGQNINQKGAVNGSIRSVSRAGTPQSVARGRSPYTIHDTHNLAAASMYNLSTLGPGRPGSQASTHLKSHASDANLRTRFGANNGSSTSLAAPAPGFAARFGANNRSSSSLAAPGPGFGARFGANNTSSLSLAPAGSGYGSRPGTPGRSKPWVNPLDVHFVRSVPSGPPTPKTPKSPLVDSMQLPPTPTTANAETGSLFGEEVDDMVDAVMATVKKREEELRKAKERERELEKQRETARLEMERLERQKSTESSLSCRRPSAPQLQPEPQRETADIPNMQGHVFKSDHDATPGSRSGPARGPLMHQGPPPTGPPTHRLPQPPGQGPPRHGPLGPSVETDGLSARGTRTDGFGPPSPRLNGFHHDSLLRSAGPPQNSPALPGHSGKVPRPYQLPPVQGAGSLGPLPHALQSPSVPLSTPSIDNEPSQSFALKSPQPKQQDPVMFNTEPDAAASNGRSTPPPATRQGLEPLISTLASPSTVTSPSGSIRRLSMDDEVVEQFARPIIQHVSARRDTFQLNSPRRHSLSMKIEELEKSILNAQHTHHAQRLQAPEANRASASSSVYSNGIKEDEDDDGPILPIHPAPLRIPSPMPPHVPTPAAADRPQSPIRAPARRVALPRRPGLEEYGVSSDHVALRNRAGTPTSASRSGSTDNYSSHGSPPSRTNTPQHRHPLLRRDLAQPSPAPTVDTFERARPSPVVDTGFNFDFGQLPGLAAPPTPDSSNWSLASPTETGPGQVPASEPVQTHPKSEPSGKFTRANVPPPLNLKFDFSPDAPSRDPTLGLWTPPIRSVPTAAATADGRPSTSSGPGGSGNGGNKLAASPSLISQFPEYVTRNDDRASFMGIGVARGPSIREVRRPKTSAGGRKNPVDSFGTGFI
ncbi:hypothetical protein N657DRAFT_261166 [Parathielavia appendiculata]|uniref:Uncharacterized protein n=1 Tax=Parathielavia appendiculata TaxID=2587402 RepID=A0AAN6YZ00_9PEZI|nr:hypothetical protein N657DRAFT_261166 [Parathielavia appendiculata]